MSWFCSPAPLLTPTSNSRLLQHHYQIHRIAWFARCNWPEDSGKRGRTVRKSDQATAEQDQERAARATTRRKKRGRACSIDTLTEWLRKVGEVETVDKRATLSHPQVTTMGQASEGNNQVKGVGQMLKVRFCIVRVPKLLCFARFAGTKSFIWTCHSIWPLLKHVHTPNKWLKKHLKKLRMG